MKYIVLILALLALVDTRIMFNTKEWVKRLEELASRKQNTEINSQIMSYYMMEHIGGVIVLIY